MTPNLITLTASDLRGCDVFDVTGDLVFLCCMFQRVILCNKSLKLSKTSTIQCHPSDYIRAWLGPVGELFPYAENAQIISSGIMFSETDSLTGYPKEISFLNCPATLASAMGSSVWRRTENGWEVVDGVWVEKV
jgi:hypothetical protein